MLKRTRVINRVKHTKFGKLLEAHFLSSSAPQYLDTEVSIRLLKFVEFLNLTVGSDEQEFAANFAEWMGGQDVILGKDLVRWLKLYSEELAKANNPEPEEVVVWSAYALNYYILTSLDDARKNEPEFMQRLEGFSMKDNLVWPAFSTWLKSDDHKDIRDQPAMMWLQMYIVEGRL